MTETLVNGYSYESTQRELSNEYQHDRALMVFKNICVLVLWMKVDPYQMKLEKPRNSQEFSRKITVFPGNSQLDLVIGLCIRSLNGFALRMKRHIS